MSDSGIVEGKDISALVKVISFKNMKDFCHSFQEESQKIQQLHKELKLVQII